MTYRRHLTRRAPARVARPQLGVESPTTPRRRSEAPAGRPPPVALHGLQRHGRLAQPRRGRPSRPADVADSTGPSDGQSSGPCAMRWTSPSGSRSSTTSRWARMGQEPYWHVRISGSPSIVLLSGRGRRTPAGDGFVVWWLASMRWPLRNQSQGPSLFGDSVATPLQIGSCPCLRTRACRHGLCGCGCVRLLAFQPRQ